MPDILVDLGPEVPALCSHPDCVARITRGRVNTCGADPVSGTCCAMPFCGYHLQGPEQTCERCAAGAEPFPRKTVNTDWTDFKLTGEAWAQWRADNPSEVAKLVQRKIAQLEAAKGEG